MPIFKFILVISALLVLVACPQKEPGIIQVGDHSLDHAEFEARVKQVHFLNPRMDRGAVAAGLIEGWLSDIVLSRDKKDFSRSDLIDERERIEKNPKTAELFRQVARLYGDDHKAFLEIGLRPDMSLRKLHGVYEKENAEEEAGREIAATALTNVQKAGISFAALATDASAILGAFQITPDGSVFDRSGKALQILAPNKRSDAEAARRLWNLASASADNTVLGIVLRTQSGYMLLKRVGEQDGNIRLETALFEAPNFGSWLSGQVEDVKVCIHDETLRFQYEKAAKTNLLNCPKP